MSELLHGLESLKRLLALLIWTGQVTDERPVSAIIVAPAGAGKTSLLENMRCEQAEFVGDLTARPLSGIIKEKEKITHILLGDMLSMFGHKSSTVKLTLRLVSQMTGEEIRHDPWTGETVRPRKIGLITAIPPEDFYKERRHIQSGGFASRFLIIRFRYTPATIKAIHKWISKNRYSQSSPSFSMDGAIPWDIKIPDDISQEIRAFSIQIKKDHLGFRDHRNVRTLTKAIARSKGRHEVQQQDLEAIEEYASFFSEEGKEL